MSKQPELPFVSSQAQSQLGDSCGTLVYNSRGVETLRKHWKGALLAISVFVLYDVIFNELIPGDGPEAFFGSLAATVLTVFLYRKIAKRLGL